ncbi:PP2C family protein-serine/threonine phosphatase [Calycomorphotria hydatis]|uniref:Phosphoserine phosphatase RsbU n=1 Tax=Calycomorphotria hydatis TaxID=2528027 RepID=A0A517TCR9_9PLAN|nr:PP2C family protein-serine/threonine phosphatase [Calycomorphotria hydatis]QDT66164.1 Phosphoserine phosphatase RsbU [Calycomorphotria hydatis]
MRTADESFLDNSHATTAPKPNQVTASAWHQSDWQKRLDHIIETMREMSQQKDPQEMVRAYGRRMQGIYPADQRISLSRRGLKHPYVRVTRYSGWDEEINPWKETDRLPLLNGGFFSDLIYADEPRIIDDLEIDPDDPAAKFLEGQQSLMAIPMLDQGESLNMVLVTRKIRAGFDREQFPETVWLANLFGRATHNLVLSDQLREAYDMVDRELKVVADIQQSLLPQQMPEIETLDLGAYYETSHRAGGDYYDFFPLPNGKWGILIADVSGHGTPAAVVMAITHSIAHMHAGHSVDPAEKLRFVNEHLSQRYTSNLGAFVTAFYGVYDPASRVLKYASAGHNPPILHRCNKEHVRTLEEARNIPLGLMEGVEYENATIQLQAGDRLVFYTDGITEAQDREGRLFGKTRLDSLLEMGCGHLPSAQCIADNIAKAVRAYSDGAMVPDDRTLIVANVK